MKNSRSPQKSFDSTCPICNVYKGKQRKDRINSLCRRCSYKKASETKLANSIKAASKNGFLDTKHVRESDGGSLLLYRLKCPTCSKDKGYLSKISIGADCFQCSANKSGIKNRGLEPPNKGMPNTEESKIKISCTKQGIQLNEFKGFITPIEQQLRTTPDMSRLKKECYGRDNYTCQCCFIRGGRLNAHHLNSWKHHLEQRYLLDNLITLCEKCHTDFHKIFGKGKSPNTREQFNEFKGKANG